ncbi:MAG: prolipoprotein diacylglyceryl transferase [Clostridia bacterium]
MNNIFLIIVFFLVIVISVAVAKRYDFTNLQAIIYAPILFTLAVFLSKLAYFIDYGSWGGKYAYGAYLLMPIAIIPVCAILKIKYLRGADLAALLSIFLMVFGKLDCMMNACCTGIELFQLDSGTIIYFPSRTLESLTALAMSIIFYKLNLKIKHRGLIYGYFLIIYGIQRSFFEYFRIDIPEFRFGVQVAYLWCSVCIIFGILWLILMPIYKKKSVKFQAQIENEEAEIKLNKIRKNKEKQANQKSKSQ